MKKVVIIGAGFAGLTVADSLIRLKLKLEIILLDKKKTVDFLPLLPDVIGGSIDAEFITSDIYSWAKRRDCKFINDEVFRVDPSNKKVYTKSQELAFDYLVIASGSETNFYGNEEIKRHAYALDSAQDALRIVSALNHKALDYCIISGGGYTGIEAATHIKARLAKLKKEMKVIIVERAPEILGLLPVWMRGYIKDNLSRLGIGVLTGKVIQKAEEKNIYLASGEVFKSSLLIWAAGVKIGSFLQDLSAERTPQGRIKVDDYLRPNESCFIIGDAANVPYKDTNLRMAVQFAISEGQLVAKNLRNIILNKPLVKFLPRDLGYIVPMANNRSCGIVFGLKFKGFLATAMHYLMCIYRSFSLRNKLGVMDNLLQRRLRMIDGALLVLRLGLGIMFVAHGLQQTSGMFAGPGIDGFSKMLSGLGFSHPVFWACLAAYTELIGGLCLIIGLFTRFAAAALLIFILVAAFKVHIAKGFFLMQGGFEYNFVIACVCVALMLAGGGKFSLTKKM